MRTVTINGTTVKVDESNPLGQGGEAYVIKISADTVLKLYKDPSDPSFAGKPDQIDGAKFRLEAHQTKLTALLSVARRLPSQVVAPMALATEKSRIVGYTMPLISGGVDLLRYGQPVFREKVPQQVAVSVLTNLHAAVSDLHPCGITAGDLNDGNVLVMPDTSVRMIDADSFGIGPYECRTYTEKFVDPKICVADPVSGAPRKVRPHTPLTDWYAFEMMTVISFCCVDMFGGVYVPGKGDKRLKYCERTMHGITFFDPRVRYPSQAWPYYRMSDDLLDHWHSTFVRGNRGVFPIALLHNMRFTTCTTCNFEHARAQCPTPGCATVAPAVKPMTTTTTVRGNVTATVVYQGRGVIRRAEVHGGKLRWIDTSANGAHREDGRTVLDGAVSQDLRFRVVSTSEYVALGGDVVYLRGDGGPAERTSVGVVGNVGMFQATDSHMFWVDSAGSLMRRGASDVAGPTMLGRVLAGRTRFWVGEHFGFGFARAGALTFGYVFSTDSAGAINDQVKLDIRGKLLDATCYVGAEHAWFMTVTEDAGRRVTKCVVVTRQGAVLASAEATAGDGSWLGAIRGAAAVHGKTGPRLLVPTDDGVVSIGTDGAGALAPTTSYPDTEPFVNAGCQLFACADGLYVISADRRKITRLVIR